MKKLLRSKTLLVNSLKDLSDADFMRSCHELFINWDWSVRGTPNQERYQHLQKISAQKLVRGQLSKEQFIQHLERAQFNRQLQISMISTQLKAFTQSDNDYELVFEVLPNLFRTNIIDEAESQFVYSLIRDGRECVHLSDLCWLLQNVKIIEEEMVGWIEKQIGKNNKQKKLCLQYLQFWAKLPKKYNPYRIWRDTFQEALKWDLSITDKLNLVSSASRIYAAHPEFLSPWSTPMLQNFIKQLYAGQMTRYPLLFRLKMYDTLKSLRMTVDVSSIIGQNNENELKSMFERTKTSIVTNLQNGVGNCLDQINMKYEKQAMIGGYPVDFFIKSKNTILQVDGPLHFWRQGSQFLYNRSDEGRKDLWKNHQPSFHFGNIPFYRWKTLNSLQRRVYLRSMLDGQSEAEASSIVC